MRKLVKLKAKLETITRFMVNDSICKLCPLLALVLVSSVLPVFLPIKPFMLPCWTGPPMGLKWLKMQVPSLGAFHGLSSTLNVLVASRLLTTNTANDSRKAKVRSDF